MKLYRLTNEIDVWYVIAEHPTEAEEKLVKHLNEADYGFTDKRKVSRIELLATEHTDIRFMSTDRLLT